jgi:hypothetical protein
MSGFRYPLTTAIEQLYQQESRRLENIKESSYD